MMPMQALLSHIHRQADEKGRVRPARRIAGRHDVEVAVEDERAPAAAADGTHTPDLPLVA
jgi:hypothetical protein